MSRRRWLLPLAALMIPWSAGAQPSKGDAALALQLFQEGKALLEARQYGPACEKLGESLRLEAGTGTLLALALCHEGQGKTATAWAEFEEVAARSVREGREDRAKAAKEHVAALVPVLSRLTIRVAAGARPAGLTVKRNGVILADPAWGVASAVDPGPHEITATAPARLPWSVRVDIGARADSQTVDVPVLASEAATVHGASSSVATSPPPPREASSDGSSRRVAGYVVGGAGVVGVALGAVFYLRASSLQSDAKVRCPASPCADANGVDLNSDARSAEKVAWIAGGLGLVGVGVGSWLVLGAGETPRAAALRLEVGPRSVRATGVW